MTGLACEPHRWAISGGGSEEALAIARQASGRGPQRSWNYSPASNRHKHCLCLVSGPMVFKMLLCGAELSMISREAFG